MRAAQQSAATVAGWLREGRRVAAGLLVDVGGSAPLDAGASMYVDADGAVEGSITGGCVETAVAEEALAQLRGGAPPRVVTYGISDELAGTAGLMCGGTVHVFVHELAAHSRDATLAGLTAVADGRPGAVATILDGASAGSKLFVDAETRVGSLRGPPLLDVNVEREARGLLANGSSALRRFGADGTTLGADVRVHLRVDAEPPKMLIVGAIDFSVALASMAAALGYRVTIADPRRAFLDSPRFSASAETLACWPREAVAAVAPGPRDAVLVFSHDPKLDVPALAAALATDAGFIGALGSRRTTAERERRLRAAGASDGDVARIHAPCGLDVGAATVEETAIAVLAEITAHRSGRSGAPLRETSGSIRRQSRDDAAAEAGEDGARVQRAL